MKKIPKRVTYDYDTLDAIFEDGTTRHMNDKEIGTWLHTRLRRSESTVDLLLIAISILFLVIFVMCMGIMGWHL